MYKYKQKDFVAPRQGLLCCSLMAGGFVAFALWQVALFLRCRWLCYSLTGGFVTLLQGLYSSMAGGFVTLWQEALLLCGRGFDFCYSVALASG